MHWRGRKWLAAGVSMALLVAGSAACAQALSWPALGKPSSGARVSGRWLWADLITTDVARSRDFYAKVFGWELRERPASTGSSRYLTIHVNGRDIGGLVAAPPDAKVGARWIGLASGDPKTMASRAREHGGAVVVAPRMLAGRGELAVLRDPDGVHFAVVRADGGDPADYVGQDNEWLWAELWSKDPARAAGFYRDVFGYTVSAAGGRSSNGYVLSAGGRARAGILRLPDAALDAVWIPYVRVASIVATVERARMNGARVVVEPRPHHQSKVAVLVDPLGAPFAVAEWSSQ
jgi:predicted enzyme related to lactoylglutathione lyase